MEKIENKEMCKKCGGRCCKKSGCDYSTKDFPSLNLNDLYTKLSEGNISIVSAVVIEKIKGKTLISPFLYLRARNTNRDVVDLLSMKTRCSLLTDTGCTYTYEDRPSGGKNLIPKSSDSGICFPKENPNDIVKEWSAYQKVLSRLVKRLTGMSVEAKFREDVTNLFYDILSENYEGIAKEEIQDIKSMILHLALAYQDEYKEAEERYKNSKKLCILNRK